MRIYMESGIEPEGLTQFSMINPIKFEDAQAILEDLAKWLRGSTFEEPPALARREDLFRRRIQDCGEHHWLLLELIAAHSRNPGDSVNYNLLKNDFSTIPRARVHEQSELNELFEKGWADLRKNGLIISSDPGAGYVTVSIGTQWWDLIVEELRNQARMKSGEHTSGTNQMKN